MTSSRLLATDLDGTFIGDTDAMLSLWRDLDDAGTLVAFSTGRHLESIESFYSEYGVTRRADACVCMVGTEIWMRVGDSYELDETWTDIISQGWDRDAAEQVMRGVPGRELQPAEWQSPFKISYFWDGAAVTQVEAVKREMADRGVEAKVVYSAGRFLDVLPIRSGKGEAVRHVAKKLDIRSESVVTAGDSGNALDMFRPELGFRSIAVGNATSEVRGFRASSLYHAEAPHAAGIREGLEHFGWLSSTDGTTP